MEAVAIEAEAEAEVVAEEEVVEVAEGDRFKKKSFHQSHLPCVQ